MILSPLEKGALGSICVPGSKSLTNRALLLAALANGESFLRGGLESDDSKVMMEALSDWGIKIQKEKEGWRIEGRGGKFKKGDQKNFLGNAGTAMRFLTAAAGLIEGNVQLYGKERMHERPLGDLINALSELGIQIKSEKGNNCPPVVISGRGKIPGGKCKISGEISSQFLSALLLISPISTNSVEIEIIGELVSKPYFEMTKNLLRQWGIHIDEVSEEGEIRKILVNPQKISPQKSFEIEADASSTAHIFSLAVASGGKIIIENFPQKSLQGDTDYLKILERFGAKIIKEKKGISVEMKGEVKALGEVNCEFIPDAAMNAVTLATLAHGKSRLTGLQTLRHKECDRIFALEKNLKKMGAEVFSGEDFIEIEGNPESLHGADIECFDDHRIAMSFASLGAKISGINILDPKCVEKTFPNFWKIFEACRAKI